MKDASDDKIYAIIDYEDTYVQPLLLTALKARLPSQLLVLIESVTSQAFSVPDKSSTAPRLLQWRQYESIDFDHLLANAGTSLANSYIIRKALIRKHYLSATVAHWVAKHPESCLKDHVKQGVEFEVDYAEFLDEALDQADGIGELRESWQRNAQLEDESDGNSEKEWWILKPGMSERGQGIRLFSSEEELQAIFEEWDPPESDDDEEHDESRSNGTTAQARDDSSGNGVMTSHLRHFVAQPYIHPPLLLASPHPSAGRKFHIRTYVLGAGALKVWVYRRMLALFAAEPYAAPDEQSLNDNLSAHLTNTCLQSGEREGSVCEFWDLPSSSSAALQDASAPDSDWRDTVFKQICAITSETFEAAVRTMSVHFQPLPNAFEVFGLDFVVDAKGRAWLLEVNAFPDFAQTGSELRAVVKELFEGIVDAAVKPFFSPGDGSSKTSERMVEVLDIDLGRR